MAKTAAKRIGANPLDALVPNKAAPKTTARSRPVKSVPARVEKERLTAHIPVELVDRVKNCVVALSGPPARLTLAAFAEESFERELKRLAKEYNAGEPFPQRDGELRGGRPLK